MNVLPLSRCRLLLPALVFALVCAVSAAFAAEDGGASLQEKLARIEAESGGRLGISLQDRLTGTRMQYRADERFPVCSTFKVLLVAAVLRKSMEDADLMGRRITYTKKELVYWSPVAEKFAGAGMTVEDLCAASLSYSDNTASNLLMKLLGGPKAVTAFARSIGDTVFRLDRWETPLNSAVPGDERDTSTPAAMEQTLGLLAFGDALASKQQGQLLTWLRGNTTGDASIRAGLPAGWKAGDKTGSGYYGTTNDIAVIWPPEGAPVVLAIYFTQPQKDAPPRKDILAAVTRLLIEELQASWKKLP